MGRVCRNRTLKQRPIDGLVCDASLGEGHQQVRGGGWVSVEGFFGVCIYLSGICVCVWGEDLCL